MNASWYELPYVAWPVGWIFGVLSSLTAKYLIGLWHKKRYKGKDYFTFTIQENEMQFEGKQKTRLLPSQILKMVKDISDDINSSDDNNTSDDNID